MFEDLIEYEDLEECSSELFGFGGVTFLRDFGPWKKDEVVACLWFDIDKGKVNETDENGMEGRSCKFQLTAIS